MAWLLYVPGIGPKSWSSVTTDTVDISEISRLMNVNAYGPIRAMKVVKSRLNKGGKVLLMTSRMGSIDDNTSGG